MYQKNSQYHLFNIYICSLSLLLCIGAKVFFTKHDRHSGNLTYLLEEHKRHLKQELNSFGEL